MADLNLGLRQALANFKYLLARLDAEFVDAYQEKVCRWRCV